MEESPLAHNRAGSPLEGAMLSHVQNQDFVAELIKKLVTMTVCCWWKLLGDEHRLVNAPWSNF